MISAEPLPSTPPSPACCCSGLCVLKARRGEVRPNPCQQFRVRPLLQQDAPSLTPRLFSSRGGPCTWLSSHQASQTISPGVGPRACGHAAGSARKISLRSRALPRTSSLTACLPWHPAPQLRLRSPRCQGFQNRVAVFWVLVLGTKQCAPAQAPTAVGPALLRPVGWPAVLAA